MHRASSSVVDSGVVAVTVPVEAVAGTQAGSEMGSGSGFGSGLQRASGCYSGGRVVDVVDGISWDGVK